MTTPADFAQQVVDLVAAEFEAVAATTLARRIIANRLRSFLDDWAGPATAAAQGNVNQVEPMTDAAAQRFGMMEQMKFGRHRGERIADVPLDYLAWIADESRKLGRDLDRYLRSPGVARRLRDTAFDDEGIGWIDESDVRADAE